MSYLVRLTKEAFNDLKESVVWYNERREKLGFEFLESLEEKLKFLEETPESLLFKFSNRRSISLKRFPFHIVYVVEKQEVVILAVAHHKREPSYWQKRKSIK